MYRLLFLCWLTACQQTPDTSATTLRLASDEYVVLAEKALTYQADFDWEGWAELLAEDVQYFLPDSTRPLVGNDAVLAYWKNWPQQTRLRSWQISHFNHIPIQSTQALHLSGLAGVYVISMCEGQLTYHDGHSRTLRLNYCLHFNDQKRIDRLYSYHNPMPMMAALK